jgi:CheY-like chemotaxis protein
MTAPNTFNKTIMVVEDNDILREGLVTIIRHAGYQVLAFADGQPALDFLDTGHQPDLVILDMLMPVVDGWQFLRAVQQWPTPAKFPIIIITGAVLGEEWPEAHGCAGFLHKPFEGNTAPCRDQTLLGEVIRFSARH